MARDIARCKSMVASIPYNDHSENQHKMLYIALRPNMVFSDYSKIEAQTHAFICQLADGSKNYSTLIRTHIGSLAFKVTYGYLPNNENDYFLRKGVGTLDILGDEYTPLGEVCLLNALPWLQKLSDWMLFNCYHIKACTWESKIELFVDESYRLVKNNLVCQIHFLQH
jgi:hypothetical protein